MFGLMQVTVLPTGLEGLAQAMQGLGFSVGQHLNRENIQRRQLGKNRQLRQALAFEGERLSREFQKGTEPISTDLGIAPETKGIDAENARLLAAKRIAESRDLALEVVLETMEGTPLTLEQQTELATREAAAEQGIQFPALMAKLNIAETEAGIATAEAEEVGANFQERLSSALMEHGIPESRATTLADQLNLQGREAEGALQLYEEWFDVMEGLEGVQKDHALQALNNPQFLTHLDRRAQMNMSALLRSMEEREDPVELFKDKFALMLDMTEGINTQMDRVAEVVQEGEPVEGQSRVAVEQLNQMLRSFKMAADRKLIPQQQAENFLTEIQDGFLGDKISIEPFVLGIEDPRNREAAEAVLQDVTQTYDTAGEALRDLEREARVGREPEAFFWNNITETERQEFRQAVQREFEVPSPDIPVENVSAREAAERSRQTQIRLSQDFANFLARVFDPRNFERPGDLGSANLMIGGQ